jgi:hypothetical protein
MLPELLILLTLSKGGRTKLPMMEPDHVIGMIPHGGREMLVDPEHFTQEVKFNHGQRRFQGLENETMIERFGR